MILTDKERAACFRLGMSLDAYAQNIEAAIIAKIGEPQKQRDDLLAALEAAKPALDLYKAYGWPDRNGVIQMVYDAIASAKGQ